MIIVGEIISYLHAAIPYLDYKSSPLIDFNSQIFDYWLIGNSFLTSQMYSSVLMSYL